MTKITYKDGYLRWSVKSTVLHPHLHDSVAIYGYLDMSSVCVANKCNYLITRSGLKGVLPRHIGCYIGKYEYIAKTLF